MKIQIINSQGHWLNGWMTQTSYLKVVVELLKRTGFEVKVTEVSNLKQLQTTLESIAPNTLVWANAYWVNGDKGQLHNLIQVIEKYQLPLLGSSLKTLLQLLEKDTCQSKMQATNIPVPSHITLKQQDREELEKIISRSNFEFPLVLKPTKEARSLGVVKANNLSEAVSAAQQILKDFPHGNLIIEEFLATDDITCGYIRMGDKQLILPSYNVVEGMDCSTEIFGQYHYTLPPEGERQVCIEDTAILEQLETYLPTIVDLFDIQTTTRVDGRLDKNGVMNFFDINGLPGLNYPISALVKQCFTHFPAYDRAFLFECLIHTIIGDNLLRYNMPVLPLIKEQNLFNLECTSPIIIEQSVNPVAQLSELRKYTFATL